METIGAFSFKTKARLQSERKPYLIDTGVLSALSAMNLPILSEQLENCIYLPSFPLNLYTTELF